MEEAFFLKKERASDYYLVSLTRNLLQSVDKGRVFKKTVNPPPSLSHFWGAHVQFEHARIRSRVPQWALNSTNIFK